MSWCLLYANIRLMGHLFSLPLRMAERLSLDSMMSICTVQVQRHADSNCSVQTIVCFNVQSWYYSFCFFNLICGVETDLTSCVDDTFSRTDISSI